MSPIDLSLIVGPAGGVVLLWIGHVLRAWLRHRHGAP